MDDQLEPPVKRFMFWSALVIAVCIVALVILVLVSIQKKKTKTEVSFIDFKEYLLKEKKELPPFPHGEYPKPVEQQPIEQVVVTTVIETQQFCPGYMYWKPLVASIFPAQEVDNAILIMSQENDTGDPARISATDDVGIFQINSCHWAKTGASTKSEGIELLKDPVINTRVALMIVQDQYWYPWTTHSILGI